MTVNYDAFDLDGYHYCRNMIGDFVLSYLRSYWANEPENKATIELTKWEYDKAFDEACRREEAIQDDI